MEFRLMFVLIVFVLVQPLLGNQPGHGEKSWTESTEINQSLDCFVDVQDENTILDPLGISLAEPTHLEETEHDSLNCFVNVETETVEDPLGISLDQTVTHEQNQQNSLNWYLNVENETMVDTFLDQSMGPEQTWPESQDCSVFADNGTTIADPFATSSDQSTTHVEFMSSTPSKTRPSSFTDVEQYSSVFASPFVRMTETVRSSQNKRDIIKTIVNGAKENCKCGKKCLSSITKHEQIQVKRDYWLNGRESRDVWLRTKLKNSNRSGRYTYIYLDNGKGLCLTGLRLLLQISKKKIAKLRPSMQRNDTLKLRQYQDKTVQAISWFENYAGMHGDRMPDSPSVLLPYKTVKRNIYKLYSEEKKPNIVSESVFYKLWKRNFNHVKIKKTNKFSQCTKCVFLQRQLSSTQCPAKRLRIRKERDLHNQRQMLERKYYYTKREASRHAPDKYLSLIIDGMDQSKTNLPHFTGRQAKIINPATLLKSHITGVLNHGHGQFRTFFDIHQYPKDPNLTINILLKTLLKIIDTKGALPPVLYVQLDNCWRENKNVYLLGFLELLVRERIFDEIHISYLLVGHTHEDIDQAFSRISESLRVNDAETIPDLLTLIPNPEELDSMLDVKQWIKPFLCEIKHITDPQHYKIYRNGTAIKVLYKRQQHSTWLSLDGRGTFLKSNTIRKPNILQPDYASVLTNIERLEKQIDSMQFMFSNCSKYSWWKRFITNIKNKKVSKKSRWITDLPKQSPRPTTQVDDTINPVIEKALLKEQEIPRVSCEKKKETKRRAKSQPRKMQGQPKCSNVKLQATQGPGKTQPTFIITILLDVLQYLHGLSFNSIWTLYLSRFLLNKTSSTKKTLQLLNSLKQNIVNEHIGHGASAILNV